MMTLLALAVGLAIIVGGMYLIAVLLLERLEMSIEPYNWQAERDICKPIPAIGSRRIAVVCTCGLYQHIEPIHDDRQQQAYDAALGAYWDDHGVMV